MKRFLFLILAALLFAGSMPTTAQAIFVNSDIQSPTITRRVTNLAALKATSGKTAIQSVQLMGRISEGDGGEGLFRWLAGDQSANPDVIADTQEGVFVKLTTPGDGSTGVWVRIYRGLNVDVEWFGAVGEDTDTPTTDNSTAINAALQFCSDVQGAGLVKLTRKYGYASKLLIPLYCGIIGDNPAYSSLIPTTGANFGTGGMIENELKTGSGQEYAWLDKVRLLGNKGNGTIAEAIVKWNQVFVNSYIRDCVISDSPGKGILFVASPDDLAIGDFGPVRIENTWARWCDDHNIVIYGDADVQIIGGASEQPAAGKDCIHIDGSLYSGTRGEVSIINPHLEFGNTGSRGIYAKQSNVDIVGGRMIGTQDAAQYNVYFDNTNDEVLTINRLTQPATIRHGVYLTKNSDEINDTYIGNLSTNKNIQMGDYFLSGQAGTDIALDVQHNHVVNLTAGSATTVDTIVDGPREGLLILRFGTGNYTIKHTAGKILLNKGANYVVPSGAALSFVRIGTFYVEIGTSI